jgi:peptidoglycan/xylan/chitin deacetylase (PgdA/CDA1 family)
MSRCPPEQLRDEWYRSRATLEDLLGAPVVMASVPGGHYSRSVGQAAAEAGFQRLFTSEPTTRVKRIGGCEVLGRYAIQASHSPSYAAAVAAGAVVPRARQLVAWNAKKVAKRLAGDLYLRVRARVLAD